MSQPEDEGCHKTYDVTNPRVQTGSNGQAFVLRFDQLERTDTGPRPTGRYIHLTMLRAEASTLLEQLQVAMNPPERPKNLN